MTNLQASLASKVGDLSLVGQRPKERSIKRLADYNWPLDGAADHGVSEAVYLCDPDGNGIEIYADRPKGQWPKGPGGEIAMYTHPLDFDMLIKELD